LKLATFVADGRERIGALSDGYIIDLNKAYAKYVEASHPPREKTLDIFPSQMLSFIEGGQRALGAAKVAIDYMRTLRYDLPRGVYREKDVTYRPPLPNPPKIVCVGLNYEDYRKILGIEAPKVPAFFLKASSTLIGHEDVIRVPPKEYGKIFQEWELAAVISKRCKGVPKEMADDHIWGYTIFHDITGHDLEQIPPRRYQQWGKNMDTFGPMGPWIVTKDQMPSGVSNLEMVRRRNGKVECRSNTSNMRFGVAEIIAFISTFMTLEPGTIIATASPPTGPIEDGDILETEIERIGTLRNRVAREMLTLDYARAIGFV